MEKYTFITNNCQAIGLYNNILNREYDTPFIGSYFQSDEQFIKFCKYYRHYIGLTPEFKEGVLPFDTQGEIRPGSYPTMFLGDIEIAWIHEINADECLEKYNRRLVRSKQKTQFFILGDSLLHQCHENKEKLISEFESIRNSYYIRKELSSEWDGFSDCDMNPGDGYARPKTWIKPDIVNTLIAEYFEKRPPEDNIVYHVYALCYNETRLLPHFLNYYKTADRIVILDNESTDNPYPCIEEYGREIIMFSTSGCFNDIKHKELKNEVWKQSKGVADFVIVQDLDEFIYFPDHPYNFKKGLYELKQKDTAYVKPIGYEMCCSDEVFDSIPTDKHVVDYIKTGFHSANYSKPILFNPNLIDETNYKEGCHVFYPTPSVNVTGHNVLLLHFKHTGVEWEYNRRIELKHRLLKNKVATGFNYGLEYFKDDDVMLQHTREFYDKAVDIEDILFPTSKYVIYNGITTDDGLCGGLGNQLFQIATTLALSYKHGMTPYLRYITNVNNYSTTLFSRLKMKDNLFYEPTTITEDYVNQHMVDFSNVTNEQNLIIKGYFQTSKYFNEYKTRILNLISLNTDDSDTVTKYMDNLRNRYATKIVGIHVRRSDYIKLNWDLPVDYYKNCINLFKEMYKGDVSFLIFTDDVGFCSLNFPGIEICNLQDYIELFIMSKLDGFIMSNSTFSWWGVYMGGIKDVLVPYPWFKNAKYNLNIYEDTWVKIEY